MEKNIDIVQSVEGYNIVVIHDIRFKGKQHIDWKAVEIYLKEYVGCFYRILETSENVFIGTDFPKEVKGSEDTRRLRGTYAKAKANAAQGVPFLLEYSINKKVQENYKEKHMSDGKLYLYDMVNVKKEKETKYPT